MFYYLERKDMKQIIVFAIFVSLLASAMAQTRHTTPAQQQRLPLARRAEARPQDSRFDERNPETLKNDFEKFIEYFKENDPESLEMMREIGNLEREARRVATDYIEEVAEQEKVNLRNRAAQVLEDATRMRVELANRLIAKLDQRLASLRERLHGQEENIQKTAGARLEGIIGEVEAGRGR
jgi:predicted RNase H-like nuclease (RuvC/YqgF family)